jgi:hypothetical protein
VVGMAIVLQTTVVPVYGDGFLANVRREHCRCRKRSKCEHGLLRPQQLIPDVIQTTHPTEPAIATSSHLSIRIAASPASYRAHGTFHHQVSDAHAAASKQLNHKSPMCVVPTQSRAAEPLRRSTPHFHGPFCHHHPI